MSGPLTWAQQGTFDEISRYLPGNQPWMFILRRIPIPSNPSRDEVLALIGKWIGRHEALHTRIHADEDGNTTQEVAQSGTLEVEVVNHPGKASAEVAESEVQQLRNTFVHSATDLPVRVTVVSIDNAPTDVIACISHVLVDNAGANVAGADLAAMLASHADNGEMPDPLPAREPMDQALHERTTAGQRINANSLAHVSTHLSAGMRGVPMETPHESPRYRAAFLRSDAIARSARILGRRYSTSSSVVFLAAMAALLNAVTGSKQHTVGLVCHNRFHPELRSTVGNLAQRAVTTLDADFETMSHVIAATSKVVLRPYARAQYDTRQVAELLNNHDPSLGIPYRFNDTWSGSVEHDEPDSARETDGESCTTFARTTFRWSECYDKDDLDMVMYLNVEGRPESVQLRVLVDTYRIPDEAVEPFLRGFERLMTKLVRCEVPLSGVAGLMTSRTQSTSR
ncbi:condensation domain-containing protein [Streptomyces sp. NPDC060184]|uniref:condensation domain-containing protein n=1 Tax=Streptomyces sp. NPDC060184 TaxID=3347064 RepID=UPI0036618BC1